MSSFSSSSACRDTRNCEAKVCRCGLKAVIKTSWIDLNPGRRFYSCALYGRQGQRQCGFFEWVDNETCLRGKEILPGLFKKLRIMEKELKSNKASKRAIIYLLLLSWVIIILLGLICLKLMAYPKNHLH
ncbi:hypothetical protein CJ030_MR4G007296 [Morella rubra]|uniref:GRF-type domain-containing protein n=1 Tax=Morella rubra TaxID=262757 RepID=A0A6A1VVS5_9ROSI|nr:hypothetical protein CJ030_MR0G007807 [Morella rubra]KAB1215634.1 hypothetical protein CJ030_MR4G007292 [Morella rubra]KAB1215638.1 hypothetical protein CJ030_MR4G007296 [Morella rubra]